MAVYACTDLHGQGWAWEKIKAILHDDDTLYFLGDAVDRGPDGVNIMIELLTRPNTIYLMGNHEDMMIDAHRSHNPGYLNNWYSNGGRITDEALTKLDNEVYNMVMECVCQLPFTANYTNKNGLTIHMSHAGFDMNSDPSTEDLLWDRNHFITDRWDIENYPNDYILHGHTPVEYLEEEREQMMLMLGLNTEITKTSAGSCFYDHGHKICIDCGVHFTGITTLFNLDTFEEIIIKNEGD